MKITFKESDIPNISQEVLKKVFENNNSNIIALSGDLGVGKTTLTKEICKQIGVKESVISPTFVIIKFYNIKYKSFKRLVHIDAYRLDSCDDLLKIGWQKIKEDKNNLIIIEWPEKVKKCLDSGSVWINLCHINEDTRVIEF